jgi:ABC-type glycerol-3-phosphate transport system substrate-binding protein
LTNEANQLALQAAPLTAALKLISDGRASGAIPVETSSLANYVETWQTLGSISNSVQTVDSLYLSMRADATDSAFVGIPGPSEPLSPMVDGWTWAISASDPARQAMAADVLNWLIAGPNMGDWSLSASRLPARRTAFEQWPAGDDYTTFLQQQLELASPYPMNAKGTLLNTLGTALFDVLSLASTPEAAAQTAVNALVQ